MPKCCPEGHIYVNQSCEYVDYLNEESKMFNNTDLINIADVYFLDVKNCSGEQFGLSSSDIVAIDKNGNVQLSFVDDIVDTNHYCVEANEHPEELMLLWCYDGTEETSQVKSYKSVGTCISKKDVYI